MRWIFLLTWCNLLLKEATWYHPDVVCFPQILAQDRGWWELLENIWLPTSALWIDCCYPSYLPSISITPWFQCSSHHDPVFDFRTLNAFSSIQSLPAHFLFSISLSALPFLKYIFSFLPSLPFNVKVNRCRPDTCWPGSYLMLSHSLLSHN